MYAFSLFIYFCIHHTHQIGSKPYLVFTTLQVVVWEASHQHRTWLQLKWGNLQPINLTRHDNQPPC